MSPADPRPAAPEARGPDAPITDGDLAALRARDQHLMDVYDALGVRWGDDPFTVIAALRAHPAGEPSEREREIEARVWREAADLLWPADKPKPDEPEWMGNFEDYAWEYAVEQAYYWAKRLRDHAAPPPEGTEHE